MGKKKKQAKQEQISAVEKKQEGLLAKNVSNLKYITEL